ncbi:hypothetical protein [Agaribacter flavus]|uniref:Uncharacterized protein n=1 Tax=Agaribacter flavus TaxID=1902781 RepID=A0ABV7FRN2_9ALTE
MLIKALLLAIWVVLLDLWIAKHFHSSLGMNELLLLVGVPLSSALFAGVVDFFVDDAEINTLKNYLKGFVKRQLNYRVLAFLYLVFALFSLSFTTVSIAPLSNDQARTVTLHHLKRDMALHTYTGKLDKVLDMHLFVNPFVTEYKLSVSGYLPKIVRVRPFLGSLVVPDRDLVELPTLLFRPLMKSSRQLVNGGWVEIYRLDQDAKFKKLSEAQGTHAWFLGPRREQSATLRNTWRIENVALGLSDKVSAILMLRWRNPNSLPIDIDIGPGQIICALITNKERKRYFAGAITKVSQQSYQDLPLEHFENEDTRHETGIHSESANDVCTTLYQGKS